MDSTGNPKSLKYFYTTLYGNLKGFGTDRLKSLTIIGEERYDNYIAIYDTLGKQTGGARNFTSSYMSGFESVHVTPTHIYALGWFGDNGIICGKTYIGGRRLFLKFPRTGDSCPAYHLIEKFSPSGSMIGGTDDELFFTGFFSDTLKVFNCSLTKPVANYHPVLVKLAGTLVNIPESENLSSLKIFPNPVRETLFISGLEENSTITVVTLLGKVLFQQKMDSESRLEVNVSDWDRGVYIFKMKSKAGLLTSKIIVE